mmetsp:Transcript_43410/g.125507  ORF Transcript_43410/g.125507 Transcript_43410/m.125507 type:complete len:111 (+) Transcript_43410:682-1014(+)
MATPTSPLSMGSFRKQSTRGPRMRTRKGFRSKRCGAFFSVEFWGLSRRAWRGPALDEASVEHGRCMCSEKALVLRTLANCRRVFPEISALVLVRSAKCACAKRSALVRTP